jgi:hypothetical protein
MRNIDDIVERFNDGDYSVLEYFSGDYQTFFKFLERRKKLIEIDPKGSLADEYQNELLIYFHNTNIDVFHHWCNELLGDIEFVDGKAYVVTDPEYFADLFCDDRDVGKDTIAKILSGNLEFDWYNSYEIDIYDNVIDDLSPENLNKLKQIFLRELSGKEISTDEGEMTLSPENIDEVFNNKDLLKEILNDELSNVKSELGSLYFSSEQNALSDEYYEEVWNELDDFFYTNDRKWVSVKRGYSWDKDGSKKDRFVEMIRLPIRDFDRFVTDYLETNKRYSNSSLEYHGSYVDILKDGGDCLSVRFPDYADSRKVRENINDMFGEYIS